MRHLAISVVLLAVVPVVPVPPFGSQPASAVTATIKLSIASVFFITILMLTNKNLRDSSLVLLFVPQNGA